jgi:glutaryl-CoA dehydrogenase
MSPFAGTDFYDIEQELSAEERMARDTVRRFVEREFLPGIRAHYRAGTFPLGLVPAMGALGLFGANLSGHGLPGIGNVAYGLIMQELERGDSGLRSFASVQGALVMYPILTFGTDGQKARWLPRLAAGEAIGCFGLTESDHGSDPSGMATRAARDGDGYLLNGSKMWITNGSVADVAVVWAKLDGRVRGFLVERGTPGFAAREVTTKLSLRASITAELTFDDCRLPADALLPGTDGLKSALACLNQARYGIAWGAVGSMTACFEEAREYAAARIQFGRPVAAFQLTQEKLADMLTDLTASQLLCLKLGRLKDAGKMHHAQLSLAKRHNVRKALEIARCCRGILGASGITDEYQAMRHACNLESVDTYEGTYEIHTLVLGKAITGIDATK